MKKITNIVLSLAFLAPFVTFAATANNLSEVMDTISGLLGQVIPILITIAVIYFIWSVIKYTLGTDEEAKKTARSGIITGLIGLFVIISFWGIVRLVQRTVGVSGSTLQKEELPTVIFN